MDLESAFQSEVSQKEKKHMSYISAYMWNLEKWYRHTNLQGSKRDAVGASKQLQWSCNFG